MRYVRSVAAIIVVALGVLVLRDATLTTHERVSADSSIEVVMRLRANGGQRDQSLTERAEALVLTCRLEVNSDPAGPIEPLRDGHFRAVLQPSMDASDRRQFRGCLEDWTLDHVRVDVIRLDELPTP